MSENPPLKLELDIADRRQLQVFMANAILGQITDVGRDKLIEQALVHMMQEKTPQYSREPTTPLQEAFDSAINEVTREVVAEAMKNNDTVRRKVEQLVTGALTQWLESDNAAMVNAIVNTITVKITEALKRSY